MRGLEPTAKPRPAMRSFTIAARPAKREERTGCRVLPGGVWVAALDFIFGGAVAKLIGEATRNHLAGPGVGDEDRSCGWLDGAFWSTSRAHR